MNRVNVVFFALFFIGIQSLLMSLEIKTLKKITLSEEDGIIIERGYSLIVTEDDRIIVSDMKAGNIKIFDMKGNRTNVFGKKGIGPNEFIRPLMSTYRKPLVAFMDYGRSMIFLYKHSGKNDLEFVQKIFNRNMGYSFRFVDDESLLIAGGKRDKDNRPYSLYQYNFKTDTYQFILPSEIAYGCGSPREYEKDLDERLAYIGTFLFCDLYKDSVYLVWKGSNEVIKFNRKTKELKRFGKVTKNYVKPYYNAEIVRAFNQKNHREIYRQNRKMSMVRDIFITGSKKVGMVYAGPYKKDNTLPIILQIFTASGTFLKEVELLSAKATHHYEVYFYFKKSNNRFYIMDTETSEAFDQIYKIHEFQVEE